MTEDQLEQETLGWLQEVAQREAAELFGGGAMCRREVHGGIFY